MSLPSQNDLFNNPMIDAARKAMTPEQIEEYKKVGEYMYNSVNYRISEIGSQVKESSEEDLILYATEGLNSGLDPYDLSQEELRALINVYGEEWYNMFDYTSDEVPKPTIQLVTAQDAQQEIERQANTLNKKSKKKKCKKKKKRRN